LAKGCKRFSAKLRQNSAAYSVANKNLNSVVMILRLI
jgi:hypothetical protein